MWLIAPLIAITFVLVLHWVFIRAARRRTARLGDSPPPPRPALVIAMAAMLVAFAAVSASLLAGVTLPRLGLFVLLAGAALFFFQRGLRTR